MMGIRRAWRWLASWWQEPICVGCEKEPALRGYVVCGRCYVDDQIRVAEFMREQSAKNKADFKTHLPRTGAGPGD